MTVGLYNVRGVHHDLTSMWESSLFFSQPVVMSDSSMYLATAADWSLSENRNIVCLGKGESDPSWFADYCRIEFLADNSVAVAAGQVVVIAGMQFLETAKSKEICEFRDWRPIHPQRSPALEFWAKSFEFGTWLEFQMDLYKRTLDVLDKRLGKVLRSTERVDDHTTRLVEVLDSAPSGIEALIEAETRRALVASLSGDKLENYCASNAWVACLNPSDLFDRVIDLRDRVARAYRRGSIPEFKFSSRADQRDNTEGRANKNNLARAIRSAFLGVSLDTIARSAADDTAGFYMSDSRLQKVYTTKNYPTTKGVSSREIFPCTQRVANERESSVLKRSIWDVVAGEKFSVGSKDTVFGSFDFVLIRENEIGSSYLARLFEAKGLDCESGSFDFLECKVEQGLHASVVDVWPSLEVVVPSTFVVHSSSSVTSYDEFDVLISEVRDFVQKECLASIDPSGAGGSQL